MQTIQYLTVMVVVTVMVYTAPSPPKLELLTEIHDVALNMSTSETPNVFVAKIGQSGAVCVREFFCLAEKALQRVKTHKLHKGKLIRLLEQFNKNETTNCTLKEDSDYFLKKFLVDIVKCADNWRIGH